MARPPVSTVRPSLSDFSSLRGGPDIYGDLLKKSSGDSDTGPVKPGEFADLIGKLSGEKKALLQRSLVLFKDLSKALSNRVAQSGDSRGATKDNTDIQIEKAAKEILVALRRDTVGAELEAQVRAQLYEAYLDSNEFEKAVALYPTLKSNVGGRLKGIYVLDMSVGLIKLSMSTLEKLALARGSMLGDYFSKITNAREGLVEILRNPSVKTPIPGVGSLDRLFHFGSRLPLYYLLSNCADLANGTCGNCERSNDTTVEIRIRLITGDSLKGVPEGILKRVCQFATENA